VLLVVNILTYHMYL